VQVNRRAERVRFNLVLGTDDLVEALDDLLEFFGSDSTDPCPKPLGRKCTDLADLYPRPLRKPRSRKFKSERKTGPWLLTRDRYRDDCTGTLIENLLTENQHRPTASLFAPPNRVKVGPVQVPPQYSGHG
jgi:hypothetical protein